MKKLLVIIILLCTQYCFAQQRELDAFRSAFISQNAFPQKELNSYYLGILEQTLYSPKGKEKYGFLHNNGKTFKSAEFDYASDFKGGKSNIRKDSIPGLLFKDGSVKYFPEYSMTYFTEGNIGLAKKDGKYGFIDLKGKSVIPLEYDDAFPFYDSYASVRKDGNWFYIDQNGNKPLSQSYIMGYGPIIDRNAIVYENVVRSSNKINPLLSATLEYAKKVSKPTFHQGLYDLKSKSLLQFPEYDEIAGFYVENYMIVIKNGKYGVIDRSSKLIIPTEYDDIREINDKMVIAKKGKWGMVDLTNKITVPFEYDRLGAFQNGLAFATKGQKSYYIDRKNQLAINLDLEFNWFGDFEDGFAVAKKDGKIGYIDDKGNIMVPFTYNDGLPFVNGKALVYSKNSNECFFIDKKGNRVLKDSYPYLWLENEGFIRFAK